MPLALPTASSRHDAERRPGGRHGEDRGLPDRIDGAVDVADLQTVLEESWFVDEEEWMTKRRTPAAASGCGARFVRTVP